MIVAERLTKHYGEKRAVDDLSFTVRPGVVTGFLGPNGSGKSTTMRLILELDAPTAGDVTVNGKHYRDHAAPLHEVGALLEARSVHTGRSAYNHLLALAQTHGIGRGRAETDEHAWLQHRDFGVEPRPTGGDLAPVRLLMDSPLALRLPLEVLDDVRDVHLGAVDLDFLERPVEQLPSGPDERAPFEVLAVAGLLADEDDVRVRATLAEDCLRAGFPERAGLAPGGRLAQLLQARPLGNERPGGVVAVD